MSISVVAMMCTTNLHQLFNLQDHAIALTDLSVETAGEGYNHHPQEIGGVQILKIHLPRIQEAHQSFSRTNQGKDLTTVQEPLSIAEDQSNHLVVSLEELQMRHL